MKWSLLGSIIRSLSGVLFVVLISGELQSSDFALYFTLLGLGSVLSVLAEGGASQKFIFSVGDIEDHIAIYKKVYCSGLIALFFMQIIVGVLLANTDNWSFRIYIICALINQLSYFSVFHRVVHEKKLNMVVVFRAEFSFLIAICALWISCEYFNNNITGGYILQLLAPYGLYCIALLSGKTLLERTNFNFKKYIEGVKSGIAYASNSGAFLLSQQLDIIASNFLLGKDQSAAYVFAKTTTLQIANVFYAGLSRFTNAQMVIMHTKFSLDDASVHKIYRFYGMVSMVLIASIGLGGIIYTQAFFDGKWAGADISIAILAVATGIRFALIPVLAKTIISSGVNKVLLSNIIYILLMLIAISVLICAEIDMSEEVLAMTVVGITLVVFLYNILIVRRV